MEDDELGWGWNRANVIACAVLGVLVLGLIIWQFSGSGHYLGSDITVEQEMVQKASAKLDPNTASPAELTSLPGIGPSLAQRIVSYRQEFKQQNGPEAQPFASWQDLQKVKGIGPKKSAKLEPHLEFKKATATMKD